VIAASIPELLLRPEAFVVIGAALLGVIWVPRLARKWARQADSLPERSDGQTLLLRPAPTSRATYVVLALTTGIGAIAIALVLGLHMPSWFLGIAWSFVCLLGLVSVLSLIPITEQFELADDHIRRRSLFSDWRTMKWQDVVRAEYQVAQQRFQINDAAGLVMRISRWMPGHRQFLELASRSVPEGALGPEWCLHVPEYLAEQDPEQ
jgi:hypothetical protein